jgi:hypothetical protein
MTRPTRTWIVTGALTTLALAGGVGVALAADGDDKPTGQVRLVVDDAKDGTDGTDGTDGNQAKDGKDCPNKGSTVTATTDPASDL